MLADHCVLLAGFGERMYSMKASCDTVFVVCTQSLYIQDILVQVVAHA
jgi:hypothetical protein